MRGGLGRRSIVRSGSMVVALGGAAGLLVTSCGSDDDATSATTQVTVTDTSLAATNTDIPAPRGSWQVAALGDSFMATQNSKGQTFVDLYAAALQGSEQRTVTVDDLSDDSNTTARLLERLRTDDSTRSSVSNADIIVISVGGNDSDPFGVYPQGTCSPTQPLPDCLATYAPTFAANYELILTEVDSLRNGQPTAVRVTSADNPFVGWSEAPTPTFGVDFYAQVAQAETDAACAAATSHAALCVDYLHIFGGPDGTADPAPFLGPDHAHPGDVGIQAISDALAQLGLSELQ